MKRTLADEELVIGVIGGMGPLATADFLAKLVAATPVKVEQDHLRVFVDSNAKVPDRNRAIATGECSPGPILAQMAVNLRASGAQFLVMACNTAHAFESSIRRATSVPFVSMIEEACDACLHDHPNATRVGLLATSGCLEAGLYQNALHKRGLTPILLNADMQASLTRILYRVKLNEPNETLRREMRALGESLISSGADVLIAACTEVPLVLRSTDLSRPVLDATLNLAQRCVRYARRLDPLPPHSLPHTLKV